MGDTFEDGDVVETSVAATHHATLACYAVTPVAVITISRSRADLWRNAYAFMGDRLRRAAEVARTKVDATDGAKAMVADFFIQHQLATNEVYCALKYSREVPDGVTFKRWKGFPKRPVPGRRAAVSASGANARRAGRKVFRHSRRAPSRQRVPGG